MNQVHELSHYPFLADLPTLSYNRRRQADRHSNL